MNDLVVITTDNKILLNDDYVSDYKKLYNLNKKTELATKEVNQKVKDFMEENNLETLSASGLVFTYRKGTVRTSLDSKRLKEELPDIYEEFSKTSQVASSVVVKVLDD